MGKYVVKDTFFLKAKVQGFRSRAAYKLMEIQKRYGIIKRGDKVLDLGCSPGGFLRVASDVAGNEGIIIGVDILDVEPLGRPNVFTIKEDILKLDIIRIMDRFGIRSFDVILSDVSPSITGIREVDEERRRILYEAIILIVDKALKQEGNFVMKSFFTETFPPVLKSLKWRFSRVIPFRPEATRSSSNEIYLVCLNKKVQIEPH